jgi:hypothetical protein
MMETELSQCAICGSEVGDEGQCRICGTVLEDGGANCGTCGKPLPALAFSCEHCKKEDSLQETDLSPEKQKLLEHFMLFPGMTKEMASRLIDEGLKDFATLIGMSLTERQRKQGIHQTIARRIMLLDVAEGEKKVSVEEKLECPICKSLIDTDSERCCVCGNSTMLGIDGSIAAKMGDKYDDICNDPAFREMPKDFQEEISDVLTEEDDDESTEQEEMEEQVDEDWESIDSDLEELKESKKPPETMMVCPICETEVVENARFCSGCGAKFTEA